MVLLLVDSTTGHILVQALFISTAAYIEKLIVNQFAS